MNEKHHRSSPLGVAGIVSGIIGFIILPGLLSPLAIILGAAAMARKENFAISAIAIMLGIGGFIGMYMVWREIMTSFFELS